jgi:hypothetical protein
MLDTFYPFRPSKRVIIIHIQRQLSRLGFCEKGENQFYNIKPDSYNRCLGSGTTFALSFGHKQTILGGGNKK